MSVRELIKKQAKLNTKVADILGKKVVTCEEGESVSSVAKKMQDSNVGSLVVLSRKAISGFLTDRDITVRCVAQNHDPRKCVAAAHMTSPVIRISMTADILDASALMAENNIKRLAVVDGNKLVGVLSISDFARVVNQPIRDVLLGVDTARQIAKMIAKARAKAS